MSIALGEAMSVDPPDARPTRCSTREPNATGIDPLIATGGDWTTPNRVYRHQNSPKSGLTPDPPRRVQENFNAHPANNAHLANNMHLAKCTMGTWIGVVMGDDGKTMGAAA